MPRLLRGFCIVTQEKLRNIARCSFALITLQMYSSKTAHANEKGKFIKKNHSDRMTEIWINQKCHLQKKVTRIVSRVLRVNKCFQLLIFYISVDFKWLITVVCCNLGLNATTMKLIFSKRNDTLYHYKRKKKWTIRFAAFPNRSI